MADAPLAAPQMVVNSRMLYTSWIPADPEAAAALLPEGGPPPAGPVYMNQYVVRLGRPDVRFGAYSLTYLGLDIAGMMDPEGVTPARYMLFYFNSNPRMRDYTVREYDLPAEPGENRRGRAGEAWWRRPRSTGRRFIRTEAAIGADVLMIARGQLTYVRQKDGRNMAGNFPYVADIADGFEVRSIQFLDPGHPVYALRPGRPTRRRGPLILLLARRLVRVPGRRLRGQLLTPSG